MDSNPIDTKTLLMAIIVVLAAETAAAALTANRPLDPLLLLGFLRLAQTTLIIAVVVRWGRGMPSIGLGATKWGGGLKKGLIWSAAFGIATVIGFAVLWMAGLNPLGLVRSPLPRQPLNLAIFFVVGGLVGPVTEEVFFRGILYGFFKRWGKWTAIVLSSLIFVLFHPLNGFPLPQAVGGVVFALAYATSQSLMAPITIHILGNLSLFSLSLLSQMGWTPLISLIP
jgi:membrane protease YdiL (CAAX protease family)